MKVYYLGPIGSFSDILVKQVFDNKIYEFYPSNTFDDILNKILTEADSIGVLPLENSITSDIHINIDNIFNNNVKIIGEASLLIKLNLIGLKNSKLENITKIISHHQPIKQASNFIKTNNLQTEIADSTAQAVQSIIKQNNPEIAAIGSSYHVKNPDITILQTNIGNEKHNITRFVFISQQDNYNNPNVVNKVTLSFKVKHIPGSLAKLLSAISSVEANLTKIESRPIPGTDWEYRFWVDIEVANHIIPKLIDVVSEESLEYKVIGMYSKGQKYES
jgi:chorismate mutase / prephenate dehydratase